MSHFLRTAAEVVGAIGVIVATAGVAAPAFTVGALATVGVTASAATVASIAGLAAAGLSEIAQLTAKKPTQVGNPMAWQSDPQAGIPHIMGRCYSGGQITYRAAYGSNDVDQTIQTVYSTGPIQGYEGFYVDGALTAIDGQQADIYDKGKLFVSSQLGLQPEAAQLGSLGPPNFTTASKMSGLAASSITFIYDTKGGHTLTTEPRCGYVVLGTPVYDPRKDSTYPGGNGPQRWNDETTWSFAGYGNPFLKALSYLIGYRQNGTLVIGVGRPIASILVDQFVDGANVCDANGWTLGGTILSTDNKWQRLGDMLASGGGQVSRDGAKIGCTVNTPRVSLATIESADIVGDWSVQAMQSRRDRINAIVPRYMAEQSVTTQDTSRKPDSNGNYPLVTTVTWGMAAAAPIVVGAYVALDGGVRQKGVDYPFVTGVAANYMAPNQVAQLARYEIENAREFGPIALPLKPRWMGFRPGDVVTGGQSLTEQGLVGQDMLIMRRERDPETMTVAMTLRSETRAKHAFALAQTTLAPATPAVSIRSGYVMPPAAGSWTATGSTLASGGASTPAITITGGTDNPAASTVVIETLAIVDYIMDEAGDPILTETGDPILKEGAVAQSWTAVAEIDASATQYVISTVASSGLYLVGISYRVRGVIGDRLVLCPIEAGTLYVPGSLAALIATSTPSAALSVTAALDPGGSTATISITAHARIYSDKTVQVNAGQLPGLAVNTAYVIFYDDPNRAGGQVAYQASTNPDDALITPASPGRHSVGTITTPTAGATTPSTGARAMGPGGVGGGGGNVRGQQLQ